MSNPHVNQTSCRVTGCPNWRSPRIGSVAEQGVQVAPDYAVLHPQPKARLSRQGPTQRAAIRESRPAQCSGARRDWRLRSVVAGGRVAMCAFANI